MSSCVYQCPTSLRPIPLPIPPQYHTISPPGRLPQGSLSIPTSFPPINISCPSSPHFTSLHPFSTPQQAPSAPSLPQLRQHSDSTLIQARHNPSHIRIRLSHNPITTKIRHNRTPIPINTPSIARFRPFSPSLHHHIAVHLISVPPRRYWRRYPAITPQSHTSQKPHLHPVPIQQHHAHLILSTTQHTIPIPNQIHRTPTGIHHQPRQSLHRASAQYQSRIVISEPRRSSLHRRIIVHPRRHVHLRHGSGKSLEPQADNRPHHTHHLHHHRKPLPVPQLRRRPSVSVVRRHRPHTCHPISEVANHITTFSAETTQDSLFNNSHKILVFSSSNH